MKPEYAENMMSLRGISDQVKGTIVDDVRFDSLTRALGTKLGRRAAVGGLLASIAAGTTVAAKQKSKDRKQRGSQDQHPGAGAPTPGKTLICHREITAGVVSYTKFSVATSAVKAHLQHGDFLFNDCCMSTDCGTGETCDSGTCKCGTGAACNQELICEGSGGAAACCLPTGTDLQAAIDATEPDNTLRLCAGTWTLDVALDISKDFRLAGAGNQQSTLNATGADRVAKVAENANVVMSDLALKNGRGVEGGCLHNSGRLALQSVRVSHGTSAFGGGIYNAVGGALTIDASIIEENTADNSFNVPYQGQGGGVWNFGDARIVNGSSIERNRASYIAGGFKNTANLFAENSSISNNTSSGRAGGLWSTEVTGTPMMTTLNNCAITGNTANDVGGGILSRTDGDVPTPILFINGGEITSNKAAWGGGIFNYSPPESIVLNGVDLSGNTPNDCGGFFGC